MNILHIEPVSEVEIYSVEIRREFTKGELETLLDSFESELDLISDNELVKQEYSQFNYKIMAYKGYESSYDNILCNGFGFSTLSLDRIHALSYSIPNFKQTFRKHFKRLKQRFKEDLGPINIIINLVAYRDIISSLKKI